MRGARHLGHRSQHLPCWPPAARARLHASMRNDCGGKTRYPESETGRTVRASASVVAAFRKRYNPAPGLLPTFDATILIVLTRYSKTSISQQHVSVCSSPVWHSLLSPWHGRSSELVLRQELPQLGAALL